MKSKLERIARSLQRGRVHPNEVLNLLIEVDNCAGLKGLCALERDLEAALSRLQRRAHPSTRLLERWLEALRIYRDTVYAAPRIAQKEARYVAY